MMCTFKGCLKAVFICQHLKIRQTTIEQPCPQLMEIGVISCGIFCYILAASTFLEKQEFCLFMNLQ